MNPTVGDVEGNRDKILSAYNDLAEQGADLVLYPEMALSGYPSDDLVLRNAYMVAIHEAVEEILRVTTNQSAAMLLPTPWREDGVLRNAVLLIEGGTIVEKRFKHHLPDYGEFDESRIFNADDRQSPIQFRGWTLGVPICEDALHEDVLTGLAEEGAELMLIPNASPYTTSKRRQRQKYFSAVSKKHELPCVYLNLVGGQDELIFGGYSFISSPAGEVVAELAHCAEDTFLTHWQRTEAGLKCLTPQAQPEMDQAQEVYQALVLALQDYALKNGFKEALVGLSGGIDSALVAALAVDALGPENVLTVMMPTKYTSPQSLMDAKRCATNLGARHEIIKMREPIAAVEGALAELFEGQEQDVTEENLQSRLRGVMLMALSNKFGGLLLATGNKSEYATGYATLYGDMCGGFAPLKDVYKSVVYDLADWRNRAKPEMAFGPEGEVIPQSILERAPSAELREDQTDQDSLPPYEVLDHVLYEMIENDKGVDEIVQNGYDRELVEDIWRMLRMNEYKRFQAAPGPKISSKAFGRDRRYPLTNGFRDDLKVG